MRKRLFYVMSVAMICGLALLSSLAQSEKNETSQVTVITSDKLTFDYKQHYALFEKNVVVTDPEMKLSCDELTVRFDLKNKVQQILATGNVRIEQEDKIALAGKAVYQVSNGEIVLTENPTVRRGRDILKGTKITFYRDQNLMICEPNAELIIHQEKGASKNSILGNSSSGKK